MGFYRTVTSLGVLIGINLAVSVFNLPVTNDLLLGNHLVEAAAALTLVSLLIDLKVINGDTSKKYFKIGILAFLAGAIFVSATFSSLFVWDNFLSITMAWFKIAPQIIFLIGIPSLWIADKLSHKGKVAGFNNVGTRGLINAFIVSSFYSMIAIYILYKYNLLYLPI